MHQNDKSDGKQIGKKNEKHEKTKKTPKITNNNIPRLIVSLFLSLATTASKIAVTGNIFVTILGTKYLRNAVSKNSINARKLIKSLRFLIFTNQFIPLLTT